MTIRIMRGTACLGTHLEPATLTVRDGRIDAISRGHVRNGDVAVPVEDIGIVTPGLVDLQVNGGKGHDLGHDPRALDGVSAWLPSTGVTAWLPTIVTAPASHYPGVFDAWRRIDRVAGAVPLGYHLEGPFLSIERKGAHRPDFIQDANDALLDLWLEQDEIRLVTVAPEREGGIQRIRRLADRGIVVSLGHTDATVEAFTAGVDAGATKATHLFNAMSAVHHRAPGAMVAALNDDRVVAGMIPDGVHTHPAMLRLAIRAKGLEGIAVVSDMMTAAGMPPGAFNLGSQRVTVDASSARLADGTLAGSILTMDQAVRNLVAWGDCTFAEAIAMAATVPSRLIGERDRGTLRAGARADLAIWDADHRVVETIIGGKSVWRR